MNQPRRPTRRKRPRPRYCVGCGMANQNPTRPCVRCGTVRAEFPPHATRGACPICHEFTLMGTPYCEWCGSSHASWSA